MAIAVINHALLVKFTDDLGFPKYTKVQLEACGIGHQYYDRFIRDNVQWIGQVDYDPEIHVRVTESAQLTGEIPEPWALRHQQFLEGEVDHNAFKEIVEGTATHVNRNAIRLATGNALLKYRVDYVEVESVIDTVNHLAVAVFDKAEDSSLSYTTDLPVEQIWTTRLSEYDGLPFLEKRAYFNDPIREDSYPWVMVGELTPEEAEIWTMHNVRPEDQVNWANVNFNDLKGEAIKRVTAKDLFAPSTTGIAHLAS